MFLQIVHLSRCMLRGFVSTVSGFWLFEYCVYLRSQVLFWVCIAFCVKQADSSEVTILHSLFFSSIMPLTPEEHSQLKHLLEKASTDSATRPSLLVEGPPESSSFFVGDTDQSEAGFSLVPFSNEVGGAMTDASKRRDGSLMEHQQPKKPHAMPKAVFPLGAMGAAPMSSFSPEHVSGTPMMNSSDASAGYVASIQFAPPMPQSEKSSNLVPELPPQVESLEEWGRTVIQFGQYKGCNMSYAELASSEDSRAKSYIKWVTARHRSSTGLLHDLAGYLVRYQFEIDYRLDEAWSGTFIPGTSVPRAMK